jgi:hypothetical protein
MRITSTKVLQTLVSNPTSVPSLEHRSPRYDVDLWDVVDVVILHDKGLWLL